MLESFVPMRDWLRPPQPLVEDVPEEMPQAADADEPESFEQQTIAESIDVHVDALGEIRRFRAALDDIVEMRMRALLTDIACAIIGRELSLREADLDAIVTRAVAREANAALRVRVHPSDAAQMQPRWNVLTDVTLRPGDAVIETAAGTIDVRLGTRVQALLDGMEW